MSKRPELFTEVDWKNKLLDYPWLSSNSEGRLLCTTCQKVGVLKVDSSKGKYIRTEWSTTGVTASGVTQEKRKTSLRRKIFDHKRSNSHVAAVQVLLSAKADKLPEQFLAQQKESFDATAKLMRTAYCVAKNNRPYVSYMESWELQEANGLDMGACQHSRFAATAMIDTISVEMKSKLCSAILGRTQKVSIMLDESTTVSKKSTMVVYLRTVWPLDDEVTCFAFPLELVELSSMTADSLIQCLLKLLRDHGFTNDYLSSHLLGACSDGASVMLGKNSGVLTQLKALFPSIILWHCMCHRIELAVGDAVKSVSGVNHVKFFLDKLYSIFSQSPKAARELQECASSVHSELLKIGRVLGVRWVASSYRSLIAVWKSYAALYKHSTNSESSKSAKHKATYVGIANTLNSPQFVHNLAVMLDALEPISDLSKQLQDENCSLGVAYKYTKRAIRTLELQKKGEIGDYFEKYESCDGVFKGVELAGGSRTPYLNKSAFLQALVDNLSQRLYANVGFQDDADFSKILEEMDVMDPQKWPTGVQSPWLAGETLLNSLCTRFGLHYHDFRDGFRDFVDEPQCVPQSVKQLQSVIHTLPVSSADCERGFSTMNVICTDLRNSLTVEHMSNLMFISLVGPSVKLFKPQPYVKIWLKSHRPGDYNQPKRAKDNETQRYSKIWKLF